MREHKVRRLPVLNLTGERAGMLTLLSMPSEQKGIRYADVVKLTMQSLSIQALKRIPS